MEEVAKHLKVTRQTVARYIKDKSLNAVRINKNYRITKQDFEKFLSSNSTLEEPIWTYRTQSKNCTLEYRGKTDEFTILLSETKGHLKAIEKNHDDPFNFFVFGDNFLVLKKLLEKYRQKIDLIYIDPPFGTGLNFNTIDDEAAYTDTLLDSEFLEFLRIRLILMRELLSEKGSIYLHIDKKIGHYVKLIMDEIFGYRNFVNDITRIKCNPKNFSRNAFGNNSDMILYYAKEKDKQIWNDLREPMDEPKMRELFPKFDPKFGYYSTNPLHAPGKTVNGDTGLPWQGILPPKGRHWRYNRAVLDNLNEQGLIEWSNSGNPRKIILASEHKGFKIQDVWEFKDKGLSYVDYPTQKNDDLLKRIIMNSSNEGSIILDCFCGSGSTLRNAHQLNRKWIGVDNSIKSFEVVQTLFKSTNTKCNYFEYTNT